MAEPTKQAVAEETDKKSSAGVSDFLVAPKKKRKNYVILALGDNFDHELAKSIENHVRSQYPNLAVAAPRSPTDLNRLFGKLVSLLVVFDDFMGSMAETIKTVAAAKKKKGPGSVPTLFLTHHPESLVTEYHGSLLAFHEVDEFLPLRNLRAPVLQMRIRSALRDTKRRRSRRFDLNMPVTYFDLSTGQTLPGRLTDMSLHGALLKSLDGRVFKVGDQIRLSIDASKVVKPTDGEFLKISAKVRRVFISGDQAGISFEYINDRQTSIIIDLLSIMMNQQMAVKRAQIHIPKRLDDGNKK